MHRFFYFYNLLGAKKLHIVPKIEVNQRLSDYLPSVFAVLTTKSAVKKAIKAKLIFVDDEIATTALWVQPGQKIEFIGEGKQLPKTYNLKLEVCYEDEYMAVINKPAGIVVSGNRFKTIENTLSFNLKPSDKEDALSQARPVHRLDNDTTGLLLIAKTKSAQIVLHEQFEKKLIKKYYQAIVIGKIEKELLVDTMIDHQTAETIFRPIDVIQSISNEFITLVEAELKTGRTHQIRIHLSSMGHPVMGDKIYGKTGRHIKGKGMFLSAVKLIFKHPINGEQIELAIKPPAKFNSFLNREKRRFEKFEDEELIKRVQKAKIRHHER